MTSAPRFQPEVMFAALERHGVRYVLIGGLAATLHGSTVRTGDADICPARDADNLDKLAAALRDLSARIRTESVEDGLRFSCDAAFFAGIDLCNLTTSAGDLDVAFRPAGTSGFDELDRNAVTYDLGDVSVRVASLDDVIRSKQTANREKDRAALPELQALQDELKRRT